VKLLFATRNRGKLAELGRLVAPLAVQVLSLDDAKVPEVVEDAPTFAGNAEKKARAAQQATGLAALADDSGLEVDALAGAPGVHSARFAGDHDDGANNRELLRRLADVPWPSRTARFRCVLALVDERGQLTLSDGTCEGRIAHAPRGAGGFGYDPLFVVGGVDERDATMAELSAEQKDRASHRGAALRGLMPALERWARGRVTLIP
jgi:XTP/dITP diphosphohydrolase